jgi:phage/plasmid-like protein (TIGR03299 family)
MEQYDLMGAYEPEGIPWHRGETGERTILWVARPTTDEAFGRILPWNPVSLNLGTLLDSEGADGWQVIRRSDNDYVLHVTRESYSILDHDLAKEAVEAFATGGAEISTLGTINNGRQGYACLTVPDGGIQVPGDTSLVQGYILITWSHDGTVVFTFKDTTVRVVCKNTLGMGLSETSRYAHRIKHTRFAKVRVKDAIAAIANAQQGMVAFAKEAEALATVEFTDEMWRTFADSLFPLPEGDDVSDLLVTRAQDKQDALLSLRGGETVAGDLAHNAWGAYNAAVEVYDHILGVTVASNKQNLSLEAEYRRTVGGGRDAEKAQALALVRQVAGVR